MSKYLLEIGVEEMPSRFVESTLSQMRELAEAFLNEEKLGYSSLKLLATPRRLVLLIDELAPGQEDIDIEVKGPAKKISFDENGNPTKPLEGFMKSQGITVNDLEYRELKGVEYVYGKVHKNGETSEEILKREIPNLVKSIHFGKSMRWGGKNLRFARPIRWIVSMKDSEVVEFDLEGIPVGNITRGHRFLGSSSIEIDHVDNFEKLLEENYVILDQKKREEAIVYGSKRLAKSLGGEIKEDPDLLEELVYIVEYPTPIVGRIKDEYLELPSIVITTPMREHLRYIPVYDSENSLLPYFITIRNGTEDHKEIVIEGNEKVLGARLEDAKFFYEEDSKKKLGDYVENLKDIVFQEKLGTMYDKEVRLEKLTGSIGRLLEVANKTLDDLSTASLLSKADLTTKMVQEFTELQGQMGAIYALNSGEKDIIAQAIFEQYLPRFAGDELPKSTTGSILAIADKLDTITGLFAIGLIPTGSQDPFGLRRNALGIINIILNKKWDIYISDIVDSSLYTYVDNNALTFDYEKVKASIMEFIHGRIKNMLLDRGNRYDIVDSIMELDKPLLKLFEIADKLDLYFKEDRSEFIDAFGRVHNILVKNSTDVEFREELLTEETEKSLYSALVKVEPEFRDSLDRGEFIEGLEILSTLVTPINDFFENTMVMAEDEDVKNNRLALLKKLDSSLGEIFNIDKVQEIR